MAIHYMEIKMNFSVGAILSALTACMVVTMTAAYQLSKNKEKQDGLIYSLLLLGLAAFWLVLFYSIYFLFAITTQYLELPKVPYFMRVLWPSALLPYAPLLAATFAWWHSFLQAIYWLTVPDLDEPDRDEFRRWHLKNLKKSICIWSAIYVALFVAVQIWYRVPYFSTISLPAPLP